MDSKPKKRIPSWMKTVVPAIAVAVVFGAAGYFITPRSAQSALQETAQNLDGIRYDLAKAVAGQKKLDKQLSATKADLASAVEQAAAAAEAAETEKVKVATAEKFIAQLNAKLDQTKADSIKSLTEAKQLAADSQVQADKARTWVETLTTRLSTVMAQKQKLDKANNVLQTDRAELAAAMTSQQQTSAELKRFITVLDLGKQQPDRTAPTTQGASEMPITVGELIRRMGYPSLTFQKLDHVEMKWSDSHTARSTDGLVTQIDGESANRAALESAEVVHPTAVRPAGQWRVGSGQRVYYADLVEMFGRPEHVAGTGGQFQACWTVGAWARQVSVTVVDGVVTQFAGLDADGGLCCELVRHRTAAYKSAGRAVQANAAAARATYKRAVDVVGRRLAEEADRKARDDGGKLAQWKMAPLESVGTWIGPANASAGSATVRAWVDCTWTESDGSKTDERRYVVVTLFGRDQKIGSAECTIFASCD